MKMYSVNNLKPIVSNDLIRLGRKRDGGYIVNQRALDKSKLLLSFGISTDWSFESDYKRWKGKTDHYQIMAYDYSVDFWSYLKLSVRYLLRALKLDRPFFNFLYSIHLIRVSIKYLIFFSNPKVKFHKTGLGLKNEGLFRSFKTMIEPHLPNLTQNEVIVKMDIEGGEYEVLSDIMAYSDYIGTVTLEFHELGQKSEAFEDLVEKMKENGFRVVHVHPNNAGGFITNTRIPALLEITFAKHNFFSPEELTTPNTRIYPLQQLDYPCVRGIPEIDMPFQ